MSWTTVAIDLAKDVFQVAVANRAGRILDRQRFRRRQFERFVDTLVEDTDAIMESSAELVLPHQVPDDFSLLTGFSMNLLYRKFRTSPVTVRISIDAEHERTYRLTGHATPKSKSIFQITVAF
jgi:hypothetical protein